MQDAPIVKSKRPYRPRTRTGCKTCRSYRIRRIKCDEALPNCQKCVSTGRKCDGYELPRESFPRPSREMTTNVFKPGEETQAIDFFLCISIDQFSGNSKSEFWNRHVLQLAHQDVGTRHALVALAQLHRDYMSSGTDPDRNQSALNHYNAAIRNHIDALSKGTQDSVKTSFAMTMAIIFICIEIMQGHLASAVGLLQHSLAVLPTSRGQHVRLYEDLVSRLQIHAKRLVNKDIFESSSLHGLKEVIVRYQAPQDWRASCQTLLKDCAAKCTSLPLQERVNRVCSILGVSTDTPTPSPISRETAAYNVIHMRRLLETMDTFTEEAHDWNEIRRAELVDSFLPLHRAIVCLAEANLGIPAAEPEDTPSISPSFTLDMGVIGPLYEVARHCRDPFLRRKIVNLLRNSKRQEGLLNSATYARIVETIIEIEETGLGIVETSRDIPPRARISKHSLSFDLKELKHTISYKPFMGPEDEVYHREILGLERESS